MAHDTVFCSFLFCSSLFYTSPSHPQQYCCTSHLHRAPLIVCPEIQLTHPPASSPAASVLFSVNVYAKIKLNEFLLGKMNATTHTTMSCKQSNNYTSIVDLKNILHEHWTPLYPGPFAVLKYTWVPTLLLLSSPTFQSFTVRHP
jgi:hypothetical protein